ncbi:MAG: hypothetical protein N2Z80_03905 [Hydrogenothermaceae bacterium]|nr:hypothetical protein [Hydrogenothermaceae bacterium]
MIIVDNVHTVKAKILVEAANSPITEEADEILKSKGVYVIPDIVSNPGGVYVSYYEWLKGNGIQNISDEYVEDSMSSKMISIYKERTGKV